MKKYHPTTLLITPRIEDWDYTTSVNANRRLLTRVIRKVKEYETRDISMYGTEDKNARTTASMLRINGGVKVERGGEGIFLPTLKLDNVLERSDEEIFAFIEKEKKDPMWLIVSQEVGNRFTSNYMKQVGAYWGCAPLQPGETAYIKAVSPRNVHTAFIGKKYTKRVETN